MSHRRGENGKQSPTYNSWVAMLQRCEYPRDKRFYNYGGRGITVCLDWHLFKNFLRDMGERPLGTTLDRYPNRDGNYEPGNCRWATAKEQAANRRPRRWWKRPLLDIGIKAERDVLRQEKSDFVRGDDR